MNQKAILLFSIIILFFTCQLSAQHENGILPMHVYGTSEYGGQQQVFDIKTDSRGVIYASNRSGLMELSGDSWKIYKIRNEIQVRTLDIDSLGRIYVGGDGEFGYFDIDSNNNGSLTYYSITKLLETTKPSLNIGIIRDIVCYQGKTFFLSNKTIYIWENDSIKTINTEDKFLQLFIVSKQLIVPIIDKGYYLIDGDSLSNIYKQKAKGLFLYSASINNKESIVFNSLLGLRTASIVRNKLQFGKRIPTFFDSQKDIKVANIIQIKSDIYSLATNKGVFIINIKGKILQYIGKEHGLKSAIATQQTIDKNNNLWVSTENGIAKIDILSNTVHFPAKKCSYSDRIEDIKRFNKNIHIITPSGLYVLNKNTRDLNREVKHFDTFNKNSISKFSKLKRKNSLRKVTTTLDSLYNDLEGPCWDLESFSVSQSQFLLISSNNFLISLDSLDNVRKIVDCYPYCSYQSKHDPRRVYIGLDGGFQSVYFSESGKWIDEGLVDGIDEVIIDIEEDEDGSLWLATNIQGVVYVKQPKFKEHHIQNPKIFNFKKGLISVDPLRIQKLGDTFLFASSIGIYNFSWKDSAFFLDTRFDIDTLKRNKFVHRLSKDRNNNLWDVVIDDESKICNVNFLQNTGSGGFEKQTVFAKKNEIVNSFAHDNNNISWYGGTDGLSKVDLAKTSNKSPKYYTYLSSVLNNNTITFGGYYKTNEGVKLEQPSSFIKTFDYGHNSFTFYFSASSPKDYSKLNYSWYLEGYEHELNWGQWSNKSYKEYTNLNEGHYIFHVRAIDIYGNISQEANYEFYIDPPWYRTIWAFLAIFLFFVSFVWLAIRISTRGLKKIIKAATAEIMEQKDLLEEKNRNIIDSIRYAQRIQEAVIPSSTRFHEHFNDSFILWKPRDIVSGDFYWLTQRNNQVFVAAADCTGHGVPGAFMSIMGISFLNQIISLPEVNNAADMLNSLRNNVITALNKEQSDTANKDGMDIALCVFDLDKKQVEYAGAYNSLYIYRNGELLETKADRMPIGVHDRDSIPFKNHIINLQSGDQIYMFSDGYIDQFGGPKGKKFMTKRFKKLLLEITGKSMAEQKEILWKQILDWRGEIEQVDDIIILGIRIE